MAKIRVVHVLHSFGTGGLEKGIATVARRASAAFEHVVLCLERSGDSARLLPPNTRVVELAKAPGNSLWFIGRLAKKLRAMRPDVVHTRGWGGMDAIVAARLAGIRALVHGEHGWGMEDPDGANVKRVFVRRALSRWVREYTCVSGAIEAWLRDQVRVRRQITRICNGVDPEVYRPGPEGLRIRQELCLPPSAFLVGVVGRLDPIKDHATLFAAFEKARASLGDCALLVVGDGPERERLEALAGPGVRFLGNRHDVPDVLRALDLFVLPSVNEGISNTILEAMATGLPVVATAVGGNPELVDDGVTGTLVPVGDRAALGAALETYGSAPGLRGAHGRGGLDRAVGSFAVEGMVRAYEAVWRRMSRPSAAST